MGHHYLDEPREPTRQERAATLPDTPKHRSRKDRRRWCGGHVGREHVPVIRLSKLAMWRRDRGYGATCQWQARYRWLRWGEPEELIGRRGRHGTTVISGYRWSCTHERGCERCGKILDPFLRDRECPDYAERIP